MLAKAYKFSWLVTLTGFVFLFMHYPFATVIMIAGGCGLLIHSAIYFFRNSSTAPVKSLFYIVIACITLYVEARFLFWGWAKVIFYLSCLEMILWLVAVVKSRSTVSGLYLVVIMVFILGVWISFTPSYKIYYFVHLNTVLNKQTREVNYRSWDRYSWYLYLRNRFDEAFEANRKAQDAASESLRISPDRDAGNYMEFLKQHEFQIVHRQWEAFP